MIGAVTPETCRVILQLNKADCILLQLVGCLLTLQRGVTGTARMLHALTHPSISRQVREQM